MGIEARCGDQATSSLLAAISHAETFARVTAEREFLRLLGAGCQTPVGAHTWFQGDQLRMAVSVFSEADSSAPPVIARASHHDPVALAAAVMREGRLSPLPTRG